MKTLVNMMAAVALPALAAGAAELEGWWRFTEPDGDEAADASGKGRAALLDTNRVWRVTDAPSSPKRASATTSGSGPSAPTAGR